MALTQSHEYHCNRTDDDIEVTKSLFGNHIIRTVTKSYQGETWTRFTIIPRQFFITAIRRESQRKQRRIPRTSVFGYASRWIVYPHHSGAGRSWAADAYVGYRNKRFVVIVQRGGLDV